MVRNERYRKNAISVRERHNERKNEVYSNPDVLLEYSHNNVTFKACEAATYARQFDRMVEEGVVSTRGLKPDAYVFDELVFDVNTDYFETHGGYEYARRFYAEVYELAKEIARTCHNSYFRPYVSTAVVGTEMAGATKNVIAVAIGAAEGMGLGINTRSTLITRGLAEMTRLGTALGADPATFAGLSGIGDLVATCSSRLSRNFSLGHRLGSGMGLAEALALSPGVVEGVASASPILQVAASVGVDMPITGAVVEVVEGRASIEDMGRMLLARPQKMDGWKIELV